MFVVLYLGDVEGTNDPPPEFKTFKEALQEVERIDRYYTPNSSYWIIYEFSKKTTGEFTKKRY